MSAMQDDSDYRPTGPILTGRRVLLMLLAFFGVMLLVNFIMATYAVKTFSGLDSDNPYDSGLAYNKEVAAARAQAALGWTVDLTRTPDGAATQLTATVKDKLGQPVAGLDATLHFYYPSTRKLDREVVASPIADGVYAGAATLPRGRWEVELDLKRDGQRQFRSRNPLIVE
jgi:nitrogen fixation protein FixH